MTRRRASSICRRRNINCPSRRARGRSRCRARLRSSSSDQNEREERSAITCESSDVVTLTRADLEQFDRNDPLRRFRDRFALPEGTIYLDGNSLGAMPKAVSARIREVVEEEW